MNNLINNLELRIKLLFKQQNQLELLGKYNSKLTEDQIDYISKI